MATIAVKLQEFNSLLRSSEFPSELINKLHSNEANKDSAYEELRERAEDLMLELASILGETKP